MLIMRMANSEN